MNTPTEPIEKKEFFLFKDNLYLGITLGTLGPLLGLIVFYFLKFETLSFIDFLGMLVLWKSFFTSVITVSLLVNGGLFTAYINSNRDDTARGVFIVTCVYAILSIILKFVI